MWENLGKSIVAEGFKSGPKSKKSPNLVTLIAYLCKCLKILPQFTELCRLKTKILLQYYPKFAHLQTLLLFLPGPIKAFELQIPSIF